MKSVTLKKMISIGIWSSIVFFSSYYIYANCLRYFVFTPKNYHFDFFWPRKYWVFTHVVSGVLATIVSPFQFITYIRAHYFRLHKFLGKVYVYGIIVSSITSFYLCATTPENVWYALGLGGFTAAWLLTAVLGMYYAIKGRIVLHKEWMIRSFVVTVGFSISRLLEDMIVNADIHVNRVERLTVLAWVSWIIPLLVTEWFIVRNRQKNEQPKRIQFVVATTERTSIHIASKDNIKASKQTVDLL